MSESVSTDPTVTVPLAVLEGLLQRVDALENTVTQLTVGLGQTASRPLIGLPDVARDTTSEDDGRAIRLFSRLERATDMTFTEYMAHVDTKETMLHAAQEAIGPYKRGFIRELFARVEFTDEPPVKLPPRPSATQSPADYEKFIDKYGKTITWQERDQPRTHTFTLTYLPGDLAPELVQFDIETVRDTQQYSHSTFTRTQQLTFTFDNSELIAVQMANKERSKKELQAMLRGKSELDKPAYRNSQIMLRLGIDPQMVYTDTKPSGTHLRVYQYDLVGEQFKATDAYLYAFEVADSLPPAKFLNQLGYILQQVPRLPDKES